MPAILEQPDVVKSSTSSPKSTAWRQASEPQSGKLTMAEAYKAADGKPFELIDGRIVFKMPDNKHADTHSLLCIRLGNYFLANPIGVVRTEFELRPWPENPYEGRLPDLSVFLNENFDHDKRYATRAPDLAIEIISADDRWTKLFEKADLYLEKGGQVVWIVDPYRRGVMVVTKNKQRWEDQQLTCPELLPGFSAAMDDIFSWPTIAEQSKSDSA